MGLQVREIDYSPFLEVNEMLFNGPMLAERYAAVGGFLKAFPDAGDPVVRDIILKAETITAADTFAMLYRLETLKRRISAMWADFNLMMTPTVGTVFRIDDIHKDPIGLNFANGYYTNFVNPLDLCALAVPNGFLASGIPMGVTFVGPAFTERRLIEIGSRFHGRRTGHLGATCFTNIVGGHY
jgi:allophanate hydrolase